MKTIDDNDEDRPLIDIALPVFNGERFLAQALDSILMQDFTNFRLIIGDNASTDATEEICRRYAAADPRITYVRRDLNIGAAPNFNELFARCDAPYFKWHAADDTISPSFISSCLTLLESDDDVVLGFTRVQIVDADGQLIRVDDPGERLSAPDRVHRFRDLVHFHRYPCFEIFGVFRTSALIGTDLIGGYAGGDRTLLADIALRGSIAVAPVDMFQQRRHDNQSVQMVSDKVKYAEWFDPRNRGRTQFPEWNRYRRYAAVLRHAALSRTEKVRCLGHLAHQFALRWRVLGGDVKRVVLPRWARSGHA